MTQRSDEEWYQRFEDALENDEGSTFFNNFGNDLERVRAADEKTVWSIVETDTGEMHLLPGYHAVNNIGYVLSARPISDAEIASGEWDEVAWSESSEPTFEP